ncbi:glycosyltransferase family 2 protein [Thermodesulfobacteriota bacterium]
MTILFFLCSLILLYTIIGYPMLVLIWAYYRPLAVNFQEQLVPISIILCVRNEDSIIQKRLQNLFNLDYPRELIEIIVVSDGSTDNTEEIVQTFEDRGVRLLTLEKPLGKASAFNLGVTSASNNILLCCDARQNFAPDVLRMLVAYFTDESVGAVSGRLIIASDESSTAGAGVEEYWNFEAWLRSKESESGSVIGVTGAIYAMRKSLYKIIPPITILDDLLIPMQIIKQGKRVIYEKKAYAYDAKVVTDANEIRRKVRTLYGNLQLLSLDSSLFLPWGNPVWFRFISHKILRLFLPLLLLGCQLSSLLGEGLLVWAGFAQLFFWVFALVSMVTEAPLKISKLAAGFLLLNIAVILAWFYWLTGRKNIWEK